VPPYRAQRPLPDFFDPAWWRCHVAAVSLLGVVVLAAGAAVAPFGTTVTAWLLLAVLGLTTATVLAIFRESPAGRSRGRDLQVRRPAAIRQGRLDASR